MGINTQHEPKKKVEKKKESEDEQEEEEEADDEKWLGKGVKYRVLKNKVRTYEQKRHDLTTQASMCQHGQRRYTQE